MRAALWGCLFLGVGCPAPTPTEPSPTDSGPECEDSERDCAGTCFGQAYEDECGNCDDRPETDCVTDVVLNGSWTCEEGVTCQDVWDLTLRRGAEVTVTVTDVTGDSKVRLGAFKPGSGPSDVNSLVGTNKDLSCGGPNEDATAVFEAEDSGTWRITVGRDAEGSKGLTGDYTLSVSSDEGISVPAREPFQDDVATRSEGLRCGSEYRFTGTWDCNTDSSCQDVYQVDLRGGSTFDVSVTELDKDSTAGISVYGPNSELGDTNLLTNNRNERTCNDAGEDEIPPVLDVTRTGTHLVAVTRVAPDSTGDSGQYVLTIGSDAFIERPRPAQQDSETRAAGRQCGWSVNVNGSWDCKKGEDCQDVYDIDLVEGMSLAVVVRDFKKTTIPRLAVFAPGEPLSGINLLTADTLDYMCDPMAMEVAAGPVPIDTTGTYRIAVGRDAATSKGTSGSYSLILFAEGEAYGREQGRSVDDEATEATGTFCPIPPPPEE